MLLNRHSLSDMCLHVATRRQMHLLLLLRNIYIQLFGLIWMHMYRWSSNTHRRRRWL